jgi:hypothetical protein
LQKATDGRIPGCGLVSLYPEIYDFRMKHSAKTVDIKKFLLKAESYTLIALIRKWVFPDED